MKKIILFPLLKRGLGGFNTSLSEKSVFFLGLIILYSSCNLNNAPGVKTPGSMDSIKISRDTISSNTKVKLLDHAPIVQDDIMGLYADGKFRIGDYEPDLTYNVVDNTHKIDSIYKYLLPHAYLHQSVYLYFIGRAVEKTGSNVVEIDSIVEMQIKNYKNTSTQYKYWCFGTEPFWQIEISEKENLIDFYEPMEQKTTHFLYSKPEIKNGSTTYSSSDKENKISIIIKKEKCNGAIDPQYDYSVQVTLNDKKYAGCASSSYYKAKASEPIN